MTECLSAGRTLWRIYDSDKNRARAEGMQPLANWDEADRYSQEGYGVFWTVQPFPPGSARRIANVGGIRWWAVDIDDHPADPEIPPVMDQDWTPVRDVCDRLKLDPTVVVRSKNGFHVYFRAEGATKQNFAEIMGRLIFHFGADPQSKDLARVLRVPGYCHWKDLHDPYPVRTIRLSEACYTERDMLRLLPLVEMRQESQNAVAFASRASGEAGDFWSRVAEIPAQVALSRLSGTEHVLGERYEFKRTSRGFNILVNGKSTSCWIDQRGMIGSTDKGGPTVAQWLNWFHRDYRRVYRILIEVFPELNKRGRRG